MPTPLVGYYPAVIVVIASLILFLVPALRRRGLYTALAAITLGVIYWTESLSYIWWILVLYGSLLCINAITARTNYQSARTRQLLAAAVGAATTDEEAAESASPVEPSFDEKARWRYSAALMFATVGAYLLGTWRFPDGVPFQMAGIVWSFRFADMWFLLRAVSFIWEFGSGATQLEGLPFLTWMILPCTVYGPLFRFRDFSKQHSALAEAFAVRRKVNGAWWRLLTLACAQIGAALLLTTVNLWVTRSHTAGHLWNGVITFGIGPLEFYFRTAGILHLMELFGCFWGLTLPPSFEQPIGQPNIAEFWKRWNMTVTSFFRDHFFFNRWGMDRANLYLNSMILFGFMGLWHAVNLHWFLYGLLHGSAFCVFMWWRAHRNSPLLKKFTLPPRAANVASRVVTYTFIGAATIIPSKLLQIVGRR